MSRVTPASAPVIGVKDAVAREDPAAARRELSWAAYAATALVRLYQLTLSPMLGPSCRYEPSCSTYAVQAVARHGALRGLWMAARRVARCHPFGGHGFDPVP